MKTSELTGAAPDWAVAKWEGVALLDPYNNEWELCWTLLADNSGDYYAPSTDWAQGGPIIEREQMEFDRDEDTQLYSAYDGVHGGVGQTHLIAAMRCYVSSKLGDEVEIPNELTEG